MVGRKSGGQLAKLPLDPNLATPRKRSVTIAGHRTSITLEDAFWTALKETAGQLDMSVSSLVAQIDASREPAALSAAIRVFLLRYYQGLLEKG
jgi:predicted DNA-binding ribbon-helix-helix protein